MRLIDRQLSQTQTSFIQANARPSGDEQNADFATDLTRQAGTEPAQPGWPRRRRYSGAVTSQENPRPVQPVEYKGEPLDPARGPGLGCFWFQMLLLLALVIVTPLSATSWGWPTWATTVLFVVMILLLLISGQTMIFLLRLVAASRSEGRRRPLASPTPTVGEIEDEAPEGPPGVRDAETEARRHPHPPATPGSDGPGMRQ